MLKFLKVPSQIHPDIQGAVNIDKILMLIALDEESTTIVLTDEVSLDIDLPIDEVIARVYAL